MRRVLLIASLAFLLPHVCSLGQGVDTTRSDTSATPESVPGLTLTKSPTSAILWAIVPGGGQLYNHDYWKVPVFLGAAAWFGYRIVHFHGLFRDMNDSISRVDAGNASTLSLLKFQRESYRDDRDINVAYLLMVEVLGMIDAYVGAHLYDFTVDGMEGTVRVSPTGASLRVAW